MIRILVRRSGSKQIESAAPEALGGLLADAGNVIWLDVIAGNSQAKEASEFLARLFQFHPLALEDAFYETHLARVDDWQKYLYMAFHAVQLGEDCALKQIELDIFLGNNYLVTIHSEQLPALTRLWDQVEKTADLNYMHSADRVLYHLFDKITTDATLVVEKMDDALDELEHEVYTQPRRDQLTKLFRMRRTVLQLRRIFGSQREAMNRLARDSLAIIHAEGRVYFRDIYDHLVRMHELTDGLREMASGALESHISVTSYRMNEVMKTLTVVTALFMPLTFVTGFFGMNFFADQYNVNNPFSPNWLFAVSMAIMILIPPVMLVWMARRGWLRTQLQDTEHKPTPLEVRR